MPADLAGLKRQENIRDMRAWVSVVLSVAGCGDAAAAFRWRVEFEDDAARARTASLEVFVTRGGCGGPVEWEQTYQGAAAPERVRALRAGRYGLHARAFDAQCVLFAERCDEVDLPTREETTVVVRATAETEQCPSECESGACVAPDGGADAPGADSAVDAPDGDARDPSSGACLRVVDGVVSCASTERDRCPIIESAMQVFYGEGSLCPDQSEPYAWGPNEGCDADLNGDGTVDTWDLTEVVLCYGKTDDDACSDADLNADGRIDDWDGCIAVCEVAGVDACCTTPSCAACLESGVPGLCSAVPRTSCDGEPQGPRIPCPRCICNADVNGEDIVDLDDVFLIRGCTLDGSGSDCARADVNCDGLVNQCDVDAAICLFGSGAGCCDGLCGGP